MTTGLRRAAVLLLVAVSVLLSGSLSSSGSAAGVAHRVQQRQLAVATLSRFKVVLRATRVGRLDATVTASGYRHTPTGWSLIATKQIRRAGFWSWFATDVCTLRVVQRAPLDSMTVRLLWGPSIGCIGPYTRRWQP